MGITQSGPVDQAAAAFAFSAVKWFFAFSAVHSHSPLKGRCLAIARLNYAEQKKGRTPCSHWDERVSAPQNSSVMQYSTPGESLLSRIPLALTGSLDPTGYVLVKSILLVAVHEVGPWVHGSRDRGVK
jgi:hypothetical protein